MTCKVQRSINKDCLRYLPHIEKIMKSLPEEFLICSECTQEVVIHKDTISNPGFGLPFASAAFVGCEAAIDKVIQGILVEGGGQNFDLHDCFGDKS